jgi:hypothetical protein
MPATLDLVAHRKRDELKNNSGESTSMCNQHVDVDYN